MTKRDVDGADACYCAEDRRYCSGEQLSLFPNYQLVTGVQSELIDSESARNRTVRLLARAHLRVRPPDHGTTDVSRCTGAARDHYRISERNISAKGELPWMHDLAEDCYARERRYLDLCHLHVLEQFDFNPVAELRPEYAGD